MVVHRPSKGWFPEPQQEERPVQPTIINDSIFSVFVFRSAAFAFSDEPTDTPLGRDVACFLHRTLRENGLSVEPVVMATEGWEFGLENGARRFALFINWIPGDQDTRYYWAVQVREPSFLRSLFGIKPRQDGIPHVVRAITEAVKGKAEIEKGRWLTTSEFRKNY
jgi:hypothetical protein